MVLGTTDIPVLTLSTVAKQGVPGDRIVFPLEPPTRLGDVDIREKSKTGRWHTSIPCGTLFSKTTMGHQNKSLLPLLEQRRMINQAEANTVDGTKPRIVLLLTITFH
jgi:hypothetical protein